jgi:hypothetical protein
VQLSVWASALPVRTLADEVGARPEERPGVPLVTNEVGPVAATRGRAMVSPGRVDCNQHCRERNGGEEGEPSHFDRGDRATRKRIGKAPGATVNWATYGS